MSTYVHTHKLVKISEQTKIVKYCWMIDTNTNLRCRHALIMRSSGLLHSTGT
jgi:hypothetical protein